MVLDEEGAVVVVLVLDEVVEPDEVDGSPAVDPGCADWPLPTHKVSTPFLIVTAMD